MNKFLEWLDENKKGVAIDNVWRATNHTLKEWGLPSLQQMDDKDWESLNKALCHALEAN